MKISVYEKLLTKLIPSQSPDVQQAIRNALHEVYICTATATS